MPGPAITSTTCIIVSVLVPVAECVFFVFCFVFYIKCTSRYKAPGICLTFSGSKLQHVTTTRTTRSTAVLNLASMY